MNPVYRAVQALALILLLALGACSTKNESEDNPFAGAEPTTPQPTTPFDSTSIEGLHRTVFKTKCANPSCHDGTFEPDFRTVESTFATMVWHGTVKPDPDTVRNLRLRVVPYQPDSSWLWERLVTNDTVNLGRMPSNGTRLAAHELARIRQWIANGARDRFGRVMQRPNRPPHLPWYLVFDQDSVRLWEQRPNGWASPFVIQKGKSMRFWLPVEDDSTQVRDLRDNWLTLSTDRKDFSNPYRIAGKLGQLWGRDWWTFEVQTTPLERGKVYYYRYSTQDPRQPQPTLIPTPQDPYWLQNNFSFVVY